MTSKRPQMGLLIEFRHHLLLIRILCVHRILNICSVYSIELFLLIEQVLLCLGFSSIVTLQVLLILLLTVEVGCLHGLICFMR